MSHDEYLRTGGYAFPQALEGAERGMTLRDWLAGQAMIAIMSQKYSAKLSREASPELCFDEALAKHAYEIADNMIAERKESK